MKPINIDYLNVLDMEALGRQSDDETILLWHRGLLLSDIALGEVMLTKAGAQGTGQMRRFA